MQALTEWFMYAPLNETTLDILCSITDRLLVRPSGNTAKLSWITGPICNSSVEEFLADLKAVVEDPSYVTAMVSDI